MRWKAIVDRFLHFLCLIVLIQIVMECAVVDNSIHQLIFIRYDLPFAGWVCDDCSSVVVSVPVRCTVYGRAV